jgi:glutathione S-transferase
MRLFHSPTSPFVRKVDVLIREAGLSGQVTLVAVTGNAVAPGTMPVAQNPLGKIPTLVTDDGQVIYDSRVICRYLDDLAGAGFYPAAPGLWRMLTLEALADGICDAAASMTYEVRLRPAEVQFAPWIEGQWAKIDRALTELEGRWLEDLEGALTIGQIGVGVALGYLDLRHGARGWRSGRPGLAGWFEGFDSRPAMAATRPVA